VLNKYNLELANLACKSESRYALCGIQVTKERTVVTDGHLLVTITAPEFERENIPLIEGIVPTEDMKPFIMPAKEALAISKAIPKNSRIPILGNAFIEAGEGDQVKAAVTDCASPRIFSFRKEPGVYPDYSKVIPAPESAEVSICLDANLLIKLLKSLAPLATKKDSAPVIVRFSDPTNPIRIDALNEDTGQKGIGVLMPMHDPKASTHAVPRRKLTVELEDGRVKNIYSDKPLEVTIVRRDYRADLDKTAFGSCQTWLPGDIAEPAKMPIEMMEFIKRDGEIEAEFSSDPAIAREAREIEEASNPVPNYPSWKEAADSNSMPKIGENPASAPAIEEEECGYIPPVSKPTAAPIPAPKARKAKPTKDFAKTGKCPVCSHENRELHLYRGHRYVGGLPKFFNGYICDACSCLVDMFKVKRVTAEDFKGKAA
jgi:hypothetical protein